MIQSITIEDGKVRGYYTVAEFAKACDVDAGTVRQWIRRGKVEALKIGTENYIPKSTPKPARKKRKDAVVHERRLFCPTTGFRCYWRVVIGRKDIEDSPLLEVAGFMNETMANLFISEQLCKRADWDDARMYGKAVKIGLPPFSADENLLSEKIRYLDQMEEVSYA